MRNLFEFIRLSVEPKRGKEVGIYKAHIEVQDTDGTRFTAVSSGYLSPLIKTRSIEGTQRLNQIKLAEAKKLNRILERLAMRSPSLNYPTPSTASQWADEPK